MLRNPTRQCSSHYRASPAIWMLLSKSVRSTGEPHSQHVNRYPPESAALSTEVTPTVRLSKALTVGCAD